MHTFSSVVVLLVMGGAACGGGGDSDAAPGTVNTASARASLDETVKVDTQMQAGMSASVSSAIQTMTAQNQSIVTPSQMREVIGMLPTHAPKPGEVARAATGTAECTPTSCTFDNYGDDNAQSGFTIDGTVSRSGDTVTFDLVYDVITPQTSLTWDIEGAVTITATSVDGAIHTVGNTTGSANGGFDVSWDIDVEYDAIVLDGTRCPIGGSVRAVSSYDVTAGGQSAQGYNVTGGATFGPACGTVTAF